MINFKQTGDFGKLTNYMEKLKSTVKLSVLDKYGQRGVAALAAATPVDTGLTASSWRYETSIESGKASITFYNSHIDNGVPIAIILQYGHGTRNGGWVEGTDYINPAIQPIFDQIAEDVWKEVKRL